MIRTALGTAVILALLAFGLAVWSHRDNPPIGSGLRTMYGPAATR